MWPLKLPPSVLPSSPSVPQLHTLHNVNAVGTSTARCASATHTALLLVSTLLGIESPARTRRIEQQQRKFNVSQTLFYLIFSIALFPIFIPLCHKIVIRHLLLSLHCFFLYRLEQKTEQQNAAHGPQHGFVYLCICALVYLYIYVFVYLCRNAE